MAFDGIVTCAVAQELKNTLLMGKIEKIYQPESDELVFHIHTKRETGGCTHRPAATMPVSI